MLTEPQARDILFLRALDEVDDAGALLTRASFENLADPTDAELAQARPERQTAVLTDRLRDRLERQFSLSLEKWRGAAGEPGITAPAFLSFALGLGSNYLGASGRVNLLLNPFIALLGWNAAVYLWLAFFANRRLKRAPAGLRDNLAFWLRHKLDRFSLGAPTASPGQSRTLAKARLRFLKLWFTECGGISRARVAATLHALAAIFAAGVIAGMYWRGLAQSFVFEWESTFIRDEPTLRSLLHVLFAPVLYLAKPLFPNGLPAVGGEGPAWIHLFALATLGYIALPRAILAWAAWRRARALARSIRLDLNHAYYIKLIDALKADRRELFLYSYSYTLSPEQRDRLGQAIRRIWGDRLQLSTRESVTWGETAIDPPARHDMETIWLFCFNGAQTPEDEVHGALVQRLLESARAKSAAFLAAVDHGRLDPERRERRRGPWAAVFAKAGLDRFAWLDLDRPIADQSSLDQFAQSIWRPPA